MKNGDRLIHPTMNRRKVLKLAATGTFAALLSPLLAGSDSSATESSVHTPTTEKEIMTQEAFVYTELQISVPFDQAPWRDLNPA